MMRDDVIKKRMKAQMPSPTPLFAGRVRQTLDRLPERRKVSILRYVPAAAMAVVTVAVIGLAVASRMNPDGMSNWFQALAGEEATATVEITPAPTPEEQQTAEETAQETVIPTETPTETVEVTPVPTPEPTQEPTPAPEITSMPATTALTCMGESVEASGQGKIAMGNNCDYIRAVINDYGTFYEIEGDTTKEILDYCDRYYKASKNGPYTKYELDPMVRSDLIFVLIDGLVDESFVGTTISEDKLNLLIAANDDDKTRGVFVKGMLSVATLEFSRKSFVLTIHNKNPKFHPTSNFTILTRYATEDGDVQYFTLPVKAK